jgi:hypothetical protein
MFEQLLEAIARGLERLSIPYMLIGGQAVLLYGEPRLTRDIVFASLEDLIIHKVLAGRPRDLEDLRGVLLKNRAFDLKYIHHWLSEFDRGLGEKSLERFEEVRQALASPSNAPSPS